MIFGYFYPTGSDSRDRKCELGVHFMLIRKFFFHWFRICMIFTSLYVDIVRNPDSGSGFRRKTGSGFSSETGFGFSAETRSGFSAETRSGFSAQTHLDTGFPAETWALFTDFFTDGVADFFADFFTDLFTCTGPHFLMREPAGVALGGFWAGRESRTGKKKKSACRKNSPLACWEVPKTGARGSA